MTSAVIETARVIFKDAKAGVVVRKMTRRDLPAALAIAQKAFPEELSAVKRCFEDYLFKKRELARAGQKIEYYVMERGGKIVGHSGLYNVPHDASGPKGFWKRLVEGLTGRRDHTVMRLGWFSVDPGERGRGLGKLLLNATEEHARRKFKADVMAVETSPIYKEATALYEKTGYARGFSQVKDYFGPGRDLHTVYRQLGKIAVPPSAGYSLEPIASKAQAEEALKAVKNAAGEDYHHLKESLGLHCKGLSVPEKDKLVSSEFYALKKGGRTLGIAGAYKWGWSDVNFVRHLHANREHLNPLVSKLLEKLKSEERRLVVVQTPKKELSGFLSEKFGFGKAHNLPAFYASDEEAARLGWQTNPSGLFYTKFLKPVRGRK